MSASRHLAVISACLLALGGEAGAARAESFSWDPLGPVPNPDGFTAAAQDPTEAGRFWVADTSTVWVTADGGQSFSVVFRMARAAGSSRSSNALEDDEDIVRDLDGFDPLDFDGDERTLPDDPLNDPDDPDAVLDPDVDPARLEEDGFAFEDAEEGADAEMGGDPALDAGEPSEDRLLQFARSAFGISRLRVIGADMWICTSRGLFRVPRDAGTLGSATELRLGRRVAVNDVAAVGGELGFVATDAGLWRVEGGMARRSRGVEYDTLVFALVVHDGRLFAATSLGLQRGDVETEVLVRNTAGGRGDGGLLDVARLPDGRLVAVDGNRAFAYDADGRSVTESWQVPGAVRLAVSPGGGIVAVGPRGVWRLDGEYGWNRIDHDLRDRRLTDALLGDGSDAEPNLRVVGRGGAWRLIRGEAVATPAQRIERAVAAALVARPGLGVLIAKADEARALTLSRIDAFATRERLAWLLPTIQSRLVVSRQRDERRTLIPAIGERVLDSVQVQPLGDRIELLALWDILPAIQASLEPSRSRVYEASRILARRSQRRVRETLPPLYRSWAAAQRRLWQNPPKDTRTAIAATLDVARLEAQLRVVSAGAFPVTDNPRDLLFPPETSP